MGYYLAFPLLALAVALQSSVFPIFHFDNYVGQPELAMLMVLTWSVHAEWEEATFWAFVAGIMQDLLSTAPVGTSALSLVIVTFGIKWMAQSLYRFHILLMLGFAVLATLLHHIILTVVFSSSGYVPDIPYMLRFFTLPTLAYNLAGVMPTYFIMRLIQRRLPRPQSAWEVGSQTHSTQR